MTNDRELMQQALEALELIHPDLVCQTAHHKHRDRHDFTADCPIKARHQQAIAALRERLAQPEMQPCAGRNCGSTNPNLKG